MHEIHTLKTGENTRVSRRKFIAIAAASTAATLPAVAIAERNHKTGRVRIGGESDPLVAAIERYRAGCEAFNVLPDFGFNDEEEARAVHLTYGPPMEALKEWDEPAVSKRGAISALRLAVEENSVHCGSDISSAMVHAALLWLEGGAA